MRLNLTISLEINPEEYPLPIDGDVRDEVEQIIRDTFYDIEGIEVEATALRAAMRRSRMSRCGRVAIYVICNLIT